MAAGVRIGRKIQGHQKILETLSDAFAENRLASTLLFVGPSGVGKKLSAFALAQDLICETPIQNRACGVCGPCNRVEKNQSESLRFVEPDGASIKIEQARDVLQFLTLQKLGRSRVVIFDQAHLMNPIAANALLKVLEEPPAGTYFILVSPLAASVLPTIRSRSQMIRFRGLNKIELKEILGDTADDWVLEAAQGSVENAERFIESKEDFQALEQAFIQYLVSAGTMFPGPESARLKELTKERGAQAYFSSLLQGVIRDGMRLQAGLQPLAPFEQLAALSKTASQFASEALSMLADRALAIENEFARNIERGLLFENFAIDWRAAGQTK